MAIRACIFDVFGTLVDWRGSVYRQLAAFARRRGVDGVDWLAFTVAWRARYQPALQEVRSGRRAWNVLDQLHREELIGLLDLHGLYWSESEINQVNAFWHRLDPWPDVVPGLTRLKRSHKIAPCSNGNIDLMQRMAAHAGLPWDCILGAEPARAYKPQPEVYLVSCRLLGFSPPEVMMVAAHNSDLAAAKNLGLATCFVPRPAEYGPGQSTDFEPDPDVVDLTVCDMVELAEKLGGRSSCEP